MATFVIYDTATGIVQGVMTAMNHDGDVMAANTPEGCSALEIDVPSGTPILGSGWKVVDNVLTQIVPTAAELLATAKDAQIAQIEAASMSAQTSGFTSSALGSAYSYPSGIQDQANLNAVATLSTFPGQPTDATYLFWCTSSADVSGFVSHTAQQIQQVGRDALAAIMSQKSKQWTLTQQITAATTIAEVQTIVW
jgi:hypothetical protein